VSENEPTIRHVSDTARWVAVYRARETERPDALFRDPFAQRLAGEHGERLAASVPFIDKTMWPFVVRTYLFDSFISEEIRQGADMVINLAAGLDARPYRMALPATLKWVEVDLPEILDHKEDVLKNEMPVCHLERIRLDLSNVNDRRKVFDQLGRNSVRALVITEGLITYLTEDEVGSLARDIAVPASFQRWLLDLASPALLRMLQKRLSTYLSQAPLKFAPQAGPAFFEPYGWKLEAVRSTLKTARQLKRLPFFLQLIATLVPQPDLPKGSRPWSGACLFAKK